MNKESNMKYDALLKRVSALILPMFVLVPSAWSATHIVTVGDNFFTPSSLTIEVGDTVEWRNAAGGMSHNVTANDRSFASVTSSSFTFSQTFDTAGTVSYLCTIHPDQMNGVITVQGGPVPEPELALTEVSVAAGSYHQGSFISIVAQVDNTGTAASGEYSVAFYASNNGTITAEDTLIGSQDRASLEAGENSNRSFNAIIPASLATGTYFIGAIVNFADSNSDNNTNADDEVIIVTEADSFKINAGMNDAWYNPATDGQGFFVTVFPNIQKMFLGWFTYDVELPDPDITATIGDPGQRYMTAFGDISGDTATLQVDLVTGGIFDSAEPVPSHQPDGTITIKFNDDCITGELTYDIIAANVAGVIPIQRIAGDNIALCKALQTQ